MVSLWKGVLPLVFLAFLLVAPAGAVPPPPIPPGPYNPKSPAENIVTVEMAYLIPDDAINLTFWIRMGSNTWPDTLNLLFTMEKTDLSEVVVYYWTGQVFGTLNTVRVSFYVSPYPDDWMNDGAKAYVAIYAWLTQSQTDRAPNTDFYPISAYVNGGGPHDVFDDSNDPQQVPSNPYHYVGGELYSANKLAVLSPYLALIGVVAVAAVVIKRRKV